MGVKGEREAGFAGGLVFALLVLTALLPAVAQAAQRTSSDSLRWHVKNVTQSGTQRMPVGGSLELSAGALEISHKNKRMVWIPLEQITQVNSINLRPAHAALAGLQTAGHVQLALMQLAPADSGATAIVFGVYGFVPTAGISAVVLSRDRYRVTVVWGNSEDASEGGSEVSFELGVAQYGAFLGQIRAATGRPWINLREDEERLKRSPEDVVSVTLRQPAMVGRAGLLAGPYQIVSLNRGAGQADLVFIAGKTINRHKIRAVAPAEFLGEGEPPAEGPVAYALREGGSQVSEVNVHGKRFRIHTETGL